MYVTRQPTVFMTPVGGRLHRRNLTFEQPQYAFIDGAYYAVPTTYPCIGGDVADMLFN